MALAAGTLPSITPTRAVPFDALLGFYTTLNTPNTLTATGYVGTAPNKQINIGPGRFDGYWVLDIESWIQASSDGQFQFFLLGCNNTSFTAGTVEILATRDVASTAALRLLATIPAASDAIPLAGRNATRFVMLFSNEMGEYVFQYLQLYVVIAGTSPSITFDSWIAPKEC